jgi:hypothetical protein
MTLSIANEKTLPLLNALVGQFNRELEQVGMRHDLSTPITPTTNYIHGLAGIFGAAGIDQNVFGTRVKPSGLIARLPAIATADDRPVVAYLTGFTDDASSTEKDGVCDPPIVAGETKSCLQGSIFGRIERRTETLEINKVGRRTNRGEFIDLRLVNDPAPDAGFGIPGIAPGDANGVMAGREVLNRFLNLGVSFERKLGPLVYTGNTANNTTNGGYSEFLGLETLVGTGKVDILTGNTCRALDSYVRDMNYAAITDGTIVRRLTTMYRYLEDIASRSGLAPVEWAFVMRRNLFDELADLWPCSYATYRCSVGDSSIGRVLVDGMAQKQMADEIRNGRYLLIDGVRIPVIIDDFLPEDSNTNNHFVVSGCFASDIYLLPLSVRGGIVSLYWEYFDYSTANGPLVAVSDGHLGPFYWTDGGRFLFTSRMTGWCVEWWALIEPRLRLLTPHLAGRLQNVKYCPLDHYREDDPDSGYFFDGGSVTRDNAAYDKTDLH